MSHSYHTKHANFHFNGDLSGDLTIITGAGEVQVDCQSVVEFVLNALRNEAIGRCNSGRCRMNHEYASLKVDRVGQAKIRGIWTWIVVASP